MFIKKNTVLLTSYTILLKSALLPLGLTAAAAAAADAGIHKKNIRIGS